MRFIADLHIHSRFSRATSSDLTPENLFVISTDFSHYPAYKDAIVSDQLIADAIVTNKPDKFLSAVENCTKNEVENLVTGCCSWPSRTARTV